MTQLYQAIARFNMPSQPQRVIHYVKPKPAEKIRERYRGDLAYLGATSGQLQLIPVKARVLR